ncbi:hypothetical protein NECAME_03512 [Necator americanus]|uniref:Uncharacterized protein n=1 Tax=Necator americanus TaxID=51031 RepID=W2T470_NECAM|nr:hypothetical protein NECAME_03512 [Necator americanus]ETN76349.1 hypothetical protein NECAME_03512 [Necator americanus]
MGCMCSTLALVGNELKQENVFRNPHILVDVQPAEESLRLQIPLKRSSQSEFSAYGSSSYPSNESLRVLRIERSKSNRTSLDMRMGMTSMSSTTSNPCCFYCRALERSPD